MPWAQGVGGSNPLAPTILQLTELQRESIGLPEAESEAYLSREQVPTGLQDFLGLPHRWL